MDSVILSASSFMVWYSPDCIPHHPSAKEGMFTGISLQEFYFRDPGDQILNTASIHKNMLISVCSSQGKHGMAVAAEPVPPCRSCGAKLCFPVMLTPQQEHWHCGIYSQPNLFCCSTSPKTPNLELSQPETSG